jgi:hypothetical protein
MTRKRYDPDKTWIDVVIGSVVILIVLGALVVLNAYVQSKTK